MTTAFSVRSISLAVATLTTAALLAGCSTAAIYQLSQPIGECNGSPVSLTIGEGQDTPVVDLAGGGSEVDLTFTGNIEDVEIEYRMGVYGENGLATVNPSLMGPSPTPSESPTVFPDPVPTGTNESFLDLFRYNNADGIYFDLTDIFVDSHMDISSDVYRVSDSMVNIFMGSRYEGFDDLGPGSDFAVLNLPGAFLVKCVAGAPNEYVAAVPVFPNHTVFETTPALSVFDDGLRLEFPAEFAGAQAIVLALPRAAGGPLSENPMTDRWLQLFSVTESDSENGVELEGDVGLDGVFIPSSPITDPRFVSGVTYNFSVFFAQSETTVRSGFFDLKVNSSGQGEFTQFEGEFLPLNAASKSLRPRIVDMRDEVVVSTKGLRTVEVGVSQSRRITSVTIGAKPAKSFDVSSGTLIVELPKLRSGIYDLIINYPNGQVKKKDFIKYEASTKLDRLVFTLASGKATWTQSLQSALREHPETVQVDCLAMVPQGIKVGPMKKKARAICSAVAEDNTKTRVVAKKRSASSSAAVVVNFWD